MESNLTFSSRSKNFIIYLINDSQVARSSGKRYWHSFTWRSIRAIRNRMPTRAFHNVIRIHRSIEDFSTRDEGFSIQILSFFSISCVCKPSFQATIYRSFEWHYGVSVKSDERYCHRKKAGWHYLRFICNRSLKVGLIILRFLPGWTFRPSGY